MKHEGPLPDEALPTGEEVLTPEESGALAEYVLGMMELPVKLGHDVFTEDSVSPEEWAQIQRLKQKFVDWAITLKIAARE